ncbi:hypothetical protein BZA70DRAFT_296071 [Myxozyma melibiosi]|uniref:Uncharacterized protein n=1 Tax=Myxozyma melibiosi TaxID=54550 RepID=A0ABR1F577_9ASCO
MDLPLVYRSSDWSSATASIHSRDRTHLQKISDYDYRLANLCLTTPTSDSKQALSLLNHALPHSSAPSLILASRALAHLALQDYEAALSDADIALDDKNISSQAENVALHARAMAYRMVGRFVDAVADYYALYVRNHLSRPGFIKTSALLLSRTMLNPEFVTGPDTLAPMVAVARYFSAYAIDFDSDSSASSLLLPDPTIADNSLKFNIAARLLLSGSHASISASIPTFLTLARDPVSSSKVKAASLELAAHLQKLTITCPSPAADQAAPAKRPEFLALISESIAIEPSVRALVARAVHLHDPGSDDFLDAISLDPQSSLPHFHRAYLRLHPAPSQSSPSSSTFSIPRTHLVRAKADLEAAIALDANFPAPVAELALLAFKQGDLATASDIFASAYPRFSSNALFLDRFAHFLYNTDRSQDLITVLHNSFSIPAVSPPPSPPPSEDVLPPPQQQFIDVSAAVHLIGLLRLHKDLIPSLSTTEQVIKFLRCASKVDPTNPEIWCLLGIHLSSPSSSSSPSTLCARANAFKNTAQFAQSEDLRAFAAKRLAANLLLERIQSVISSPSSSSSSSTTDPAAATANSANAAAAQLLKWSYLLFD